MIDAEPLRQSRIQGPPSVVATRHGMTALYNHVLAAQNPMEADRINSIENTLHDLAARAQELRRYL